MKSTKMNIGIAISRNFNVVKLDMVDVELEHESDEDLKALVRQKFNLIRTEVDLEFSKMSK